MKIPIFKKISLLAASALLSIASILANTIGASAASVSFGLSPMSQAIVLNPGETYNGTFKIVNTSDSETFNYKIEIHPFTINDSDGQYLTVFEEYGNYGQIIEWTTLNSPDTGSVAPRENVDVNFSINVPVNAPASGQYLGFTVFSDSSKAAQDNSTGISEVMTIGHLVFAEVAGTTVRQGEIASMDVPGFLFDGNIAGTSNVKNTGNVHGVANYKLQVFPLFSDEEVYTNEEEPQTKTIIPERTLFNTTSWNKTPNIGIFNVIYTVEFEGVTSQVKKMVIVCPIWLLAIIIFAIISIIIYLVAKSKNRKKGN